MQRREWRSLASVGLSAYEVSDFGEVRRAALSTMQKRSSKFLRGHFGRYVGFNLKNDHGITRQYGVHKLVLFAFVGPKPTTRHQAAHYDGNTHNNKRVNLRWATPKENNADKVRHGTNFGGRVVHNLHLTEEIVSQIRKEYAALPIKCERKRHGGPAELMRKFRISESTLYNILHKVTWSSRMPAPAKGKYAA